MADIDAVLERLVTDPAFRTHVGSNAAEALAAYDLSAEDLQLLASSIDDSEGGQRGVEQRTSKSAVVGLLASLTGGGGGGGGKGQASDYLAAPSGNSAPSGVSSYLEIDGIKGEANPGAAVDMFAPTGGSSNLEIDGIKGEAGLVGSPEYFAPTGGSGPDISSYGDVKIGSADDLGYRVDQKVPMLSNSAGSASVQGNLAPSDASEHLVQKWPNASEDAGISGNLAPDSARKLEMPQMKAGDTSLEVSQMKAGDTSVVTERSATGNGGGVPDVNGDGVPDLNGDTDASQLIGLLSPPSGKADPAAAADIFTVEDA